MVLGFIGAGSGFICALWWPTLCRPVPGLIVMTLGIVAAGFSPYQFVSWEHRSSFTWIPLYEYYTNTTLGAFYDAAIGLLYFALFTAFLKASCDGSRWAVIAGAMTLAGAIECMQLLLPTRSAGITDVLIAFLGAWMGDYVWSMLQGTSASHGRLRRHG
jgi:glycopeptide antibiotics resistance protein